MRIIRDAKLFAGSFTSTEYVREATCGGQDSELTGEQRTMTHTFHILTDDLRMAQAAFAIACAPYIDDKRFSTQSVHEITPWLNLYTTL